jgi:hypothetical protein
MGDGVTDWSATGDMLSGIGTIAGALAIVMAAWLGRSAVTDYRHQKIVDRELQHAERALAVAYRIRLAVSSIRSPMSTAVELSTSKEELEKTDWFVELPEGGQNRTVQANVFYQRIRFFAPAFDEAVEVLPLVKAYFGDEAEKAMTELIHARHSVRVYADAYSRDEGADPEFSSKIRSYIWKGQDQTASIR